MRSTSLLPLIFSAAWGAPTTASNPKLADFKILNIDHDLTLLPQGEFSGQNWANGSNTLYFRDSMQAFTFVPKKPPTKSLETRYTGNDADGYYDCWTFQNELDHGGVDQAIKDLRRLVTTSTTPSTDGFQIGRWYYLVQYYDLPYRGYNYNGAYVYYCRNTNVNGYDAINMNDINFSTAHMDADCGAYKPGYWQWANSNTLFGKCDSGTHVCAGSDL